VNEVSFRARPHHNVRNTLGVDRGATGPWWRVESVEGDGVRRGWGKEWKDEMRRSKDTSTTSRDA
jgi:hypothetical protein